MKQAIMTLTTIFILLAALPLFAGDCGDVNNTSAVNIQDITYLINFLYKDGSAPDCGTVTDIDGNVYQTVKIGNQTWMMENLKVTHYRNGDPIPHVIDSAAWESITSGAYCDFNNDANNVATYGRLYNWYAVKDSRNIAPEGWHVPTDADWKQLEIFLGLSQAEADVSGWRGTTEGGELKESGTTHWASPNSGANNESGFTALPGGYRYHLFGAYRDLDTSASFWSSTEYTDSFAAWGRFLIYNHAGIQRSFHYKNHGASIRCVRD